MYTLLYVAIRTSSWLKRNTWSISLLVHIYACVHCRVAMQLNLYVSIHLSIYILYSGIQHSSGNIASLGPAGGCYSGESIKKIGYSPRVFDCLTLDSSEFFSCQIDIHQSPALSHTIQFPLRGQFALVLAGSQACISFKITYFLTWR